VKDSFFLGSCIFLYVSIRAADPFRGATWHISPWGSA